MYFDPVLFLRRKKPYRSVPKSLVVFASTSKLAIIISLHRAFTSLSLSMSITFMKRLPFYWPLADVGRLVVVPPLLFSRWLQRGPAAVDETISQGGSTHKNGILICQSPRFFFLLCADMFSSVRRRKSRRYTKNTLFLGSLARNSDGRSCLFSASEGSETEWKPRF